ncbi:hypothetical protein D3C87_1203980 [compost metagenome]
MQLTLALEYRSELDKERRGLFVLALQVGPEQVKRRFAIQGDLDMSLGHFGIEAPLRGIGGRLAAIVQAHPMRLTGSLQASLDTGISPSHEQTPLKGLQIEPRAHKKEDVIMRVPAVVNGTLTPVRDLERPDLADAGHVVKQRLGSSPRIERLERLRLAIQDLREVIVEPVWSGQGHQQHLATLRLVKCHS